MLESWVLAVAAETPRRLAAAARRLGRAIRDGILWPPPIDARLETRPEYAVLRYKARASESDQPSFRRLRLLRCADHLAAAAERTRTTIGLNHGHENHDSPRLRIPSRFRLLGTGSIRRLLITL
jgi:hypothetical protein